MTSTKHFLLPGESGNHRIRIGDHVEITEAYQSPETQIALVQDLSVNGRAHRLRIPSSSTRALKPTGPVHGKIASVSRVGKDLLITVSTVE